MAITLAHTAQDGIHADRTAKGINVVYAGTASASANFLVDPWQRAWRGYGAPAQADGLVLMVAPGYRPEMIPINPGQ